MDPIVIRNFAIALFTGALIGLEREKRKTAEQSALGGIRTFILLAMAGSVAAWLSAELGQYWIFAVTLLAATAFVLAGYTITVGSGAALPGLTTEVAALVTVLLGGLVMFGWPALGVGLGIVTSAVLAFKAPLHSLVARLGEDDIYAGLKLLIATFIVLPLLPNRALDPLGALNPRQLWLLVILIAALSEVGYVAVRMLGEARGSAITGFLGGLVSSTAVTLGFSRKSREQGTVVDALAAGILVAWLVMVIRIVVIVAVVDRRLVPALALPMAAIGVATLVAALVFLRRSAGHGTNRHDPVQVTNPFSLTAAARFAAFFAVILLVVAAVERYMPPQGMYLVAGIAGLTDVDAISLSMARFARDGGDVFIASRAVTLAALTNTAVKGGMVMALGTRDLARRLTPALLIILAAGLVAAFVL